MNIKTSRGNIIIQLSTSAAFTSANFYQLAKAGFYDGLIFHRVVPNFVVQGGDPESTGQGGPGFSIREELSLQNHSRGSLGIATSGKDTGGSQFFFNNSNNIHLNNNYTVFAHILEGIEIIDRFEVGDKIISITEL
ncbi:MAG: peptidyl-prolyl cis-trans isomerase [Gammaproteobacteria bacterium]|nr:MAG: peptidyl-prolyl cis-trans isomerase [Gammaproteobacteria bacterium]